MSDKDPVPIIEDSHSPRVHEDSLPPGHGIRPYNWMDCLKTGADVYMVTSNSFPQLDSQNVCNVAKVLGFMVSLKGL